MKLLHNVNILKDDWFGLAMEARCPRCNCLPSECKASETPYDCPNCKWKQCECWAKNNEIE